MHSSEIFLNNLLQTLKHLHNMKQLLSIIIGPALKANRTELTNTLLGITGLMLILALAACL